MNRRDFLKGTMATVGAAVPSVQPPSPPQRLRYKRILRQEDFQYLGYHEIDLGGEFSLGLGLTHRYVDGQLRMLALTHAPSGTSFRLRELMLPDRFGTRITQAVDGWTDIWGGTIANPAGRHHGLWWDHERERLWAHSAIDYPNDSQMGRTGAITIARLKSGGAVDARGLFGLENVGARRIYGGATAVPPWFQRMFNVGPYAVGFGGYASRMAQGLPVSMGPVLIAIPDPETLDDNGSVPADQYRVLMDHTSGNGSRDWYGKGSLLPQTFDRGSRTGDYVNFYEGDGRYPDRPGSWQKAPDGRGRWVWGDSAYQTGMWIDLPTKHGFVLIPTVHTGNVWYQNSTLNWDGRTAEFHVYDPMELGEVARRRRPAWGVKPTEIWRPDWQVTMKTKGQGNSAINSVSGATFDATTGRLYVRWNLATGTWPNTRDRIFVWQLS